MFFSFIFYCVRYCYCVPIIDVAGPLVKAHEHKAAFSIFFLAKFADKHALFIIIIAIYATTVLYIVMNNKCLCPGFMV